MSSFSQLRFRHFFFNQIYKPYLRFTQFGILVYAIFAIFDYQTLSSDSHFVIWVRLAFVLLASLVLHYLSKVGWKHLEMTELLFFIFAGWIVNWVGYVAMLEGNNNYQSGVMLIMLYLSTLSRMRFSLALSAMVTILIPYMTFLYPTLLDTDYAKESDHISIVITTMIICAFAAYRRELEVHKRYQQERQMRRQSLALASYSQRLKTQSETDGLTGLYNRHFLRHVLLPKLRQFDNLGVFIADIDHFKMINDRYGHDVGDNVIQNELKSFTMLCHKTAQQFVMVVRSFWCCCLTATKPALICSATISMTNVKNAALNTVTLSVGYWHGSRFDSSLKYAISEADMALYQAKQNGRNQVKAA